MQVLNKSEDCRISGMEEMNILEVRARMAAITITVISILILVLHWIVFKMRRRHLEVCGEKIPGDKALPIIGNMWPFLKAKSSADVFNLISEKGKRYHEYGIYRAWIGHVLTVAVYDPKYIEIIANSPYAAEKGPTYSISLGGFPKGVFTINDTVTWRELRKPLTKMLTKKRLESEYNNIFINHNKRFIAYLEEKMSGKEIDVYPETSNLTFDILSETILGVNTNEVRESQFHFLDYALKYIDRAISIGPELIGAKFLGLLKSIIKEKVMEKNELGMKTFLSWVFEERKKEYLQCNKGTVKYYPDFLLRRKIQKQLSMDDIERELLDVAFAGSETTAVVISSVVLFLAMFPDIQEKVYEEQISLFGENSMEEPTPDELASMEYLKRVIKETLRFCCPAVNIKHATGDIKLDDYTVPKDTIIVILVDIIGQDKRYWEKPMTFYPDHFLPEKEAERHPYAFLPFGCGPRICPGIQYAMNSVKMTISYIVRNFKLSTSIKFEDISVEHKLMRNYKCYSVMFKERIKSKC